MQQESALTVPVPRRRVRRIQPSRGLVPIDLGELWRYHELLYYLVWRDIKARYKQTVLGGVWAILRPLVMMVVFAAIFGGLGGITSGSDVPYPLFLYAGLIPWTYFQSTLTNGAPSLLNNGSLIGKAYFPRLYAPLAAVASPLVDLVLSFVVLIGLFAYYQRLPSWHIVFLPLFILLALLSGLSIALWLAGATVRYRDIGFALPFLGQIWMYLTPVIYPASIVPERFRWLLALNPVTAVVGGTRWALLGVSAPSVGAVVVSSISTLLLVVSGLFVFRRSERTIVDMI
jgi:lipopolysaccharide transport system permease protein